jgi:hypothetical protein
VSDRSKQDVSLWSGCIAGGLLETELMDLVHGAGFDDVEVIRGADVFAGAAQHSNAAAYGTVGVGIRARKPADEAAADFGSHRQPLADGGLAVRP